MWIQEVHHLYIGMFTKKCTLLRISGFQASNHSTKKRYNGYSPKNRYPISFGKGTTSSNVFCQGICYTLRKLTVYPVCPWKMMVGRLSLLLKCSLFRSHSFIFVRVVPWRQRLAVHLRDALHHGLLCRAIAAEVRFGHATGNLVPRIIENATS